jgi:hypothetical protein
MDLATVLYVQALLEPQLRSASLQEAARLIDAQPQEYRMLHDVQTWRTRVADAMRGLPLPPARGTGLDAGA